MIRTFSLSRRVKAASGFSLSGRVKDLKRYIQLFGHLSFSDVLFLTIILFLPTQLGKHFWTSFSSVAGIRIDYLSPTIFATDILLVCLFLFLSYDHLVKKKMAKDLHDTRSLLSGKHFIFTALIALVVGAALSQSPPLSFYYLLRVAEIVFLAFCTKRFLEASPLAPRLFSVSLLAAVLFESSLAVFQFLVQQSAGTAFYLLGERMLSPDVPGVALASVYGKLVFRPYGTFSHPNVLAGFLLISGSIIGIMSFLDKKGSVLGKAFISLVLFLAALAIILTLSRTVIFLLLCLLLVLCLLVIRQKPSQRLLLLPVALGVFFFSFLPLLAGRFLSHDFFGESFEDRLILAVAAVQMIVHRPFYGVGLGQFIPTLPDYIYPLQFSLMQPVHNMYLLLLAETGVLGFAGAFAVGFYGIKKQLRKKTFLYAVPFILCMLLALGDHYLLTQQQGRLLLGIVLGILFVETKIFAARLTKNTNKLDRTRRRKKIMRYGVPI